MFIDGPSDCDNILTYNYFRLSCPLLCSIYMVTMSSQVVGGGMETVCAQVHGPTEPLSLRVILQLEQANTTLLEETGVSQDFYRCLSFQVYLPLPLI